MGHHRWKEEKERRRIPEALGFRLDESSGASQDGYGCGLKEHTWVVEMLELDDLIPRGTDRGDRLILDGRRADGRRS